MAQPVAYTRLYSFTTWSTTYPTTPHAGVRIDAELNAVKLTTDQIRANMALLQRDDGQLANNSVGPQQLTAELLIGVQIPTDWVTGTAYARLDVVYQANVLYICNTAHTSGVFATDLAAAKWTSIVDYSAPLATANASAAAAAASQVAALASADAAAASKVLAEAYASAAAASAVLAASYLSSITFPIPIAQGGTGGTTLGQAQTNLGITTPDPFIVSIAALGTAADKGIYTTGVDTAAEYTLTAVGRTLVGQATQTLTRTTGLGASATGEAVFVAASTAAARSALGSTTVGDAVFIAASVAAARTALSLTPGTDVMAQDAELASIAGLTSAADRLPYFTGSGTAALATFTSVARTLVSQATQATMRTTGLGSTTVGDAVFVAANAAAAQAALALGTAALVADSSLVHISGTETITGAKTFPSGVKVSGSSSDSISMDIENTFSGAKKYTLFSSGGGPAANGAFGIYDNTIPGTVFSIIDGDTRIYAAPTSLATNSAGFRGIPANAGGTVGSAYTLVLDDSGRQFYGYHPTTTFAITIPPNSSVAFPIGHAVVIKGYPGTVAFTIAEGAGVTLFRADGVVGSGTRTVSQYATVILTKVATNVWDISGVFT